MSASPFPRPARASAADTIRVVRRVLAPIGARGTAAGRGDADRRAARLLAALRAQYGPGPLRLRIPGREFAVVLDPGDVRRVLEGTPAPFAAASPNGALRHAEPHGMPVAREPERADRRFDEVMLDTGRPVHRAGDAIATTARQEAGWLLTGADMLTYDELVAAWRRTTRRVVLGDAARDDERTTRLLLHPRRRRTRAELLRRVRGYQDAAGPGTGLLGAVPVTPADGPLQQVTRWLAAFDAAAAALGRTLALLDAHPEQAAPARAEARGGDPGLPFLRACVQEAVRLWPAAPAILRATTAVTDWGEGALPEGTVIVIPAPFLHRDGAHLPWADHFAPWTWLDGRARESWSIVPFGAGPAGCPGRDVVLLTSSTFLATLIERHELRLPRPGPLDPRRPLPGTLDPAGFRFLVAPA